ncbi:hypothetical protein [Roseibium sp. MMSF_3412]|uniref:hypothetical protein n=1 Tax=Roseibium sp. MMSF_3412 TaxID=3046712 RepID=UPI00273DD7AC|nr:hypothetical protein [Roseibium sp. MMSF_3412]
MKPPVASPSIPAKQAHAIKTSSMKRVQPPRPAKSPEMVTQGPDIEALVETLRNRINDLEARVAELESVISFQGQDVVISSSKSVLIQGMDTVEISAGSKIMAGASMYEANVPIAKFSGVLECDVLTTNTVIASVYTPGAGNIW